MRILPLFLMALTLCATSAFGESTQSPPSFLGKVFGKKENFPELNRQRRTFLAEIAVLERDIRTLEGQVEQIRRDADKAPEELRFIGEQLSAIDAALKDAEQSVRGKVSVPPAGSATQFQSRIDFLKTLPPSNLREQKNQLEKRQQDLNEKAVRLVSLNNEVKKKRDELELKRLGAAETEERIGIALNIESEKYFYRSIVSLIFAVIVFFLVFRFFSIVDSDPAVRRSIFAGDAGIQFVTLFSIVIAVILFGILEILGSNELSALLGGLSGYILGKHQQKPDPGPPAAPPLPLPQGAAGGANAGAPVQAGAPGGATPQPPAPDRNAG